MLDHPTIRSPPPQQSNSPPQLPCPPQIAPVRRISHSRQSKAPSLDYSPFHSLPKDDSGHEVISKKTIILQEQKQKEEERLHNLKAEEERKKREDRSRRAEEEKEKVFQDKTISNWVVSKRSKEGMDRETNRFNQGDLDKEGLKAIRIMNVDWYDTEIRRNIENKGFDVNTVLLSNFKEIHQNFKLNEIEMQPLFNSENEDDMHKDGADRIRNYIDSILESKAD